MQAHTLICYYNSTLIINVYYVNVITSKLSQMIQQYSPTIILHLHDIVTGTGHS